MNYAEQAMSTTLSDLDRNHAAAQQFAAQKAMTPPRPAIAGLSASLERLQHLGFTTGDLAQRISGPVNDICGGNAEGKTAPQPNDLRALVSALETAISRVEANVQRAMDHL